MSQTEGPPPASGAPGTVVGTARPRLAWMDTLRGVAVFLVIFSHGVELSPYGAPRVLVVVDRALAPFRVPALMFLSGMLLPASLTKPWRVYLRGKVSRIAWPYLVWSVIIIALSSFGAPAQPPLVELFVRPTSPTWFVGYLFVFYVLVMFARPAVRTGLLLPVLAAAVLLDPVQGLARASEVEHGLLTRFFFTFFCFLAGDVLARHQARWVPALTRVGVTVVCVVLALPAAVLCVEEFAVRYQPLFLASTLAGILATVPALTRLAGTGVGRFLAAQGRSSIVFYLVHYPAQVVAWHAAVAFGIRSGLAVVLIDLAAGVAGGFVMVWLRRRVPAVDYLFDLHLERFVPRRRRPTAEVPVPRPGPGVSAPSPAPAAEA